MREFDKPLGRLAQLALAIVLHQRDLVALREPVNDQLRDARNQALMAFHNDVHVPQGGRSHRV